MDFPLAEISFLHRKCKEQRACSISFVKPSSTLLRFVARVIILSRNPVLKVESFSL